MREYWNNSNATREAIDNERWMHTGDLAIMNADGYLNIVGRTKDMISHSGEKIFPKEVEDFLYTHPRISDVQVIGVPSSKYGEEVMAWVKLRPGTIATAEELREYCKGKIAYFKIPVLQIHRRFSNDRNRKDPKIQDERNLDKRVRVA